MGLTKVEGNCPHCDKLIPVGTEVSNTELGCEDCGSHSGIICPFCDEPIDEIYHDFGGHDYGI